MGHRRQVRGVGLDQEAVERHRAHGLAQRLGLLEGHDARERDEKAEIQGFLREVRRAGETMKNAGDSAFLDGAAENFCSIILGFAGVDDQRQPGLPGGIDMRLEPLALGRSFRIVVMVVETALADRDCARMRRGFDECCRAEIGMSVGFVRVNSDAGPDVRVTLRRA